MITTNLNGKTPDIAEENIQKLKQIFPDVFTEGKIDFDKLQQVLGNYTEDSNERYNFTWNGKGQALRLSQTPSQGTLCPCKEESKDWNTTQNLYVEGDNLEVLKLLQKSYYGKVKMIYIDPPYNTGNDFVYPDDFSDSIENYKRITKQVDSEGNRVSTNTETSGRYHTDWLNMMYPRLRLARNLLTDDGVIFISIADSNDNSEAHNLRKLCDEILGEDNFLCNAIWDLGTGTSAGHFTRSHEYILVYCKNKQVLPNFQAISDENIVHGALKKISKANPASEITFPVGFPFEGEDAVFTGVLGGSEQEFILSDKMEFKNGKLVAPTTIKAGWGMANQVRDWMDGKETFDSKGQKVVRFYFNKQGILFYEKERGTYNPKSVFSGIANTKNGSSELESIFGNKYFDFPKPVELIKHLMLLVSKENDIILDFFSGSATTAHALMQLNAEDGGKRKFICVQLPETCKEDSEAFKAGYKNICEIGKERIRRAGEKIKQEKGLEAQNLDIGFKVLKLDTSNIRKWQPDTENLEQTLLDYIDNYVDGRTELDVVYEIMLKYGLDLTYPVDEFTVVQKKVYSIGFGMLMICLDDEITTEVAKGILVQVKELAPESTRVVFKDNGFKSDSNKTNIKEILKCGGIEEFITL